MVKYAVLTAVFAAFLFAAAGCGDKKAGDAGFGDMRAGVVHYGAGGSLPGQCVDCSVN